LNLQMYLNASSGACIRSHVNWMKLYNQLQTI